MNMIERVARAIALNAGHVTDKHWPHYVKAARAAIEAMREPSPVMMLSGETVESKHGPVGAVAAYMAYRAMILAALNEKDETE